MNPLPAAFLGALRTQCGDRLGKIDALERECGPAIEVMRTIKRTPDPKNIMNPGKVLQV